MASRRWMLPLLILGTGAVALVPAARQPNRESLRSALDAVARKQRSLDAADSPEYYNDLHSFKYHGGGADRKFDRDFDEEDEEIEFLPGKRTGSKRDFSRRVKAKTAKNPAFSLSHYIDLYNKFI